MAGISNGDLAELLATRAESETGFRQKAFKRAARAAFQWPEEASDLLAGGRSLEELHSVGPFIGEQLRGWIDILLLGQRRVIRFAAIFSPWLKRAKF